MRRTLFFALGVILGVGAVVGYYQGLGIIGSSVLGSVGGTVMIGTLLSSLSIKRHSVFQEQEFELKEFAPQKKKKVLLEREIKEILGKTSAEVKLSADNFVTSGKVDTVFPPFSITEEKIVYNYRIAFCVLARQFADKVQEAKQLYLADNRQTKNSYYLQILQPFIKSYESNTTAIIFIYSFHKREGFEEIFQALCHSETFLIFRNAIVQDTEEEYLSKLYDFCVMTRSLGTKYLNAEEREFFSSKLRR